MTHELVDLVPHKTRIKQDITDHTIIVVRAPGGGDLTGWTITGEVRDRQPTEGDPTSNVLETFTVAGTTEFTLTLTPTQNGTIGLGTSFWQVDGVDPGGENFRLAHGPYELEG